MMTRFTAKHSLVLPCQWQFKAKDADPPRVFAVVLRSPRGQLTLILANREAALIQTRVRWQGLDGKTVFHRYEVTEDKVKQPGFKLAAESQLTLKARQPEFDHALPPRSIVVFSTYNLKPDAPGIMVEPSP